MLGPHAGGVLIVDETGDPKRGHRIVLAAQQYLGKLGHVANGVVAVTSHWTDGSRHVPLGVKPYRPASRLPKGRKDPAFHTKPALAWQLIEEARAAGIPFRLVVADSVYGENADAGGAASSPPRSPTSWACARRMGPGKWSTDRASPARLHPRRGGAAPPAVRLAAHRALRQPRQGARPLRRRAGAGAGLWPDHERAPDRRDPGPGAPASPSRPGIWPPPCRSPRSAPRRSTRSTACATGSSTTTSRSSMSWAGPTTRCARSGRLCAIGSW